MKRPVLIILSVVVAFVLVGSLLMNLFGPRIGQTYSEISYALPGSGGGGVPEEFASAPIQPLR